MSGTTLRGTLIGSRIAESPHGLRVEAWDKDLIFDDLIGGAAIDPHGRFEITVRTGFQELFLDRRPDVFFKVFDGERLIYDSRDSVICNLDRTDVEVVLKIGARQEHGEGPAPTPVPDHRIQVAGTAVLSSGWDQGVTVEAFADAELTASLGKASVGAGGRFEIEVSKPPEQVWFAWSNGTVRGRSPELQPFGSNEPVRLHVYGRQVPAPFRGKSSATFHGSVRSVSDRPVVGASVYLLEVTLRRCHVLGQATTGATGSYVISYDRNALLADRADLRVVVFDDHGAPLVESRHASITLPNRFAETASLFNRVADALRAEGVVASDDLRLTEEDLGYVANRSGIPVESVAAFAAAASLEKELRVPRAALFALLDRSGTLDPRVALEQAVDQDIVSPALLRRLPQLQAAIASAGKRAAANKDLGRGTIEQLLAITVDDSTARTTIAEAMLDARDGSALRARLEAAGLASPRLSFLLDVQDVIGLDVPLARVLSRAFDRKEVSSTRDLLSWPTPKWEALLGDAGTTPLDGKTRRRQARALKQRVQKLFPNEAFRAELARHANDGWVAEIRRYLAEHPDYDFAKSSEASDGANALRAYKRVLGVTGEHGAVGALLNNHLPSARAVAGLPSDVFVRRFSEAFDGDEDAAMEAHTRATRKTIALNYAGSFLPIGARPSLCACAHCKSIFGPAAYLFELLAFLGRYSSADGTLLEHFDEKRPDVQRVRLSCANTNIEVPQIDLVNEILEDLILEPSGAAVGRGLAPGECLPGARETRGTSDERRAVPQNEPSPALVTLLAGATSSWRLPYDHGRDLARSARQILISRPQDVALAVWRYSAASAGVEAATSALATSMLDLGEPSGRLITEPSTLEAAWGSTVATAASTGGPTLADLKRVASTDYETLEAIIDTWFVRGTIEAAALRLDPEDPCESEDPPRLVGSPEVLAGVLDRIHRFERLRGHLGWSVEDLDQALQWLGGTLDAQALQRLGLLRFLELRLGTKPAELLAVFRDPSEQAPPTLRARAVSSPFEARFGAGSATPDVPGTELTSADRIRVFTAQIAETAGQPSAAVERAFEQGFVAPMRSVGDVLSGSDVHRGFRRGVSATFRIALLSRRLRVSETELIDLLGLGGLAPLPGDGAADPARQLTDAVRLVDLADRRSTWPVSASELRYLVGDSPAAIRAHALSASDVGRVLQQLRQAIRAAREARGSLPVEPRAALRMLLTRLLRAAQPDVLNTTDAEALAKAFADGLEWSAFFPPLANEASDALARVVPHWPGLLGVTSPDPAARASELAAALDTLTDRVPDWLARGPAVLPDAGAASTELGALVTEVRAAVTRTLQSASFDGAGAISAAVASFLATAGAPSVDALTESKRILALALEHVSALLEVQRAALARSVLPPLEIAEARTIVAGAVRDWVHRARSVSEPTVDTLLTTLSNPLEPAQSILDAFVNPAGATPDLDASVVGARYFRVDSVTPDALTVEQIERAEALEETTLAFDWSERPPLPGLKGERFAAVLQTTLPAVDLDAAPLVVETDGHVLVQLDVDGVMRTIVDFNAGGVLGHATATVAGGIAPGARVTLHIRYVASGAEGQRVFKLLQRSTDGELDELHWATLARAVLRLDRIALASRDSALPPAAWNVLRRNAVVARAVDLDDYAAGASKEAWLRLFALRRLWNRLRHRDAASAWLALLTGSAVERSKLLHALNVEATELVDALALLGASDSSADPVALGSETDLDMMASALGLVDLAGRFQLPATALARWNDASANEIARWAMAALRVNVEPAEWSKLLAAVHDPVRANLRDAQLEFVMATNSELSSRQAISDHLLTDVEMSPCMSTSRIQFAYAAVQRYVDMALSGRSPGPTAGEQEERFAREWSWRRLYRLSEAFLRILVHPENWIEPELRPTKTPAFEKLERTLQSGPLTMHLAEQGLREYAADLAAVSRLETVAMVTHDEIDTSRPAAFRDSELPGTHVFARTRAHPQRLYYRRRLPAPDGRWTPWERIDADMEGTHYVAVVTFGRLRLICADFAVARSTRPDACDKSNERISSRAAAGSVALTDYEVSLSWIDRDHGQWSSVHRSSRFPFAIPLSDPPSIEDLEPHIPMAQYGAIELEPGQRATRLWARLQFGPDDAAASFVNSIKPGSSLEIYLLTSSAEYRMDRVEGRGDGQHTSDQQDVALTALTTAGIDPEDISGIKLLWYAPYHAFDGDDVTISRLALELTRGSTVVASAALAAGGDYYVNHTDTAIKSERTGFRIRLRTQDLGDPWGQQLKFVGALSSRMELGTVTPEPSDFEVEYEIVPQSVDLSRAVRVEAVNDGEDSLSLRIYSLASTTKARMRARFRLRDEAFERVPEAAGQWTTDWVISDDFCFDYSTDDRALATLHIFPDDTIESGERATIRAGTHLGTTASGQDLLARKTLGEQVIEWMGGERARNEIFCDGNEVAAATNNYNLVVQRDRSVSTSSSPKILEEQHEIGADPARTFFVERVAGGGSGPSDSVLLPPLITLAASNDSIARIYENAFFGSNGTNLIVDASRHLERLGDYFLQSFVGGVWSFRTFWHPQAVGFRRLLEARGLPRLLRIENQQLGSSTDLRDERERVDFFEDYEPTGFVARPWPRDVVDFTIDGPFSEYNWELFFDAALYIAKRFDEDGQFDDADVIFNLLIDSAKAGNPGIWQEPSFFKTAPIRAAVDLDRSGVAALVDGDQFRREILAQIERIQQNPFQPHIIARGWPSVYARTLRIRYAEHVIRAGEHHFRRAYQADSRSDLEIASARFDLAARVLGTADDQFSATSGDDIACYASLVHSASDAPTETDVLEGYLPSDILSGSSDAPIISGALAHFCVPPNDKLDELRAIVADRLLKLRSCRDIDGVRQALSLYGQRIDPALLVRATAGGMDPDVLLGRISGAKPTMYFSALWSRATQACERARSFEETWLGALERADSEAMAQLQNEHEIKSLELGVELRSQQLQDAQRLQEALERAIESAELRHEFYSTRQKVSALENAEGQALKEAAAADARAAADSRSASDWAWVPTVEIFGDAGVQFPLQGTPPTPFYARAGVALRYRLGGDTAVQVYRANADGHRNDGGAARIDAGLRGRSALFERRAEEWKQLAATALKDLQKGELDRASAEIRIQIAQLEYDLQRSRVDDAKTIRTFLRDKFTNQQLHGWRASRLEQLRYQQHRIAYDLTVQAGAALARELGLEDQGFVLDTWDSSRKGVGSATALLHELEKQQQTYLHAARREQEKIKMYSLADRQPLALLELLQRGETIFSITESDFDEDGAGDWFRRIHHVSVDIPSVRGPYTNINARLTQLRGEVRIRAHGSSDPESYPRVDRDDMRFRDDLSNGDQIVTNTGVQDDGRVDSRQDPERPPPFTYNGAISTFRLELPPSLNHFDRQTITDVVIRIVITSRPGGDLAAVAATQARRKLLSERAEPIMLPLHSVFSNAWHRFTQGLAREGGSELVLAVEESHIPVRLLPAAGIVQSSLYFAHPLDAALEVDGAVGQVSHPRELIPSEDDPRPSLPIRRLALAEPLRLGESRSIAFQRTDVAPRRGWLVCWVVQAGGN